MKQETRGLRAIRMLENGGDIAPSIVVYITTDVIMCSVRRHSGKCLLAQGIRYLGSDIYNVVVTADLARFNFNGRRYFYPIPADCQVKIKDWDDGKDVESFKVKLTNGASRPVLTYPKRPYAKRSARKGGTHIVGARACIKRYHGLKIIERTVSN